MRTNTFKTSRMGSRLPQSCPEKTDADSPEAVGGQHDLLFRLRTARAGYYGDNSPFFNQSPRTHGRQLDGHDLLLLCGDDGVDGLDLGVCELLNLVLAFFLDIL